MKVPNWRTFYQFTSFKMFYSIAIPAYKAKFLKECIECVLNQSYKDFELIIINDCSPENIEEIVQGFNDSRISYFKNEINIGAENVVDNWNKCLSKASGDFFVLLGDDDILHKKYLEIFHYLIKSNPKLDVYHCASNIIDEDSKIIGKSPQWKKYENVYENMLNRIQFKRKQYISDFVYRTIALKKNGGFYKLPMAWASDDISAYIAMSNKGIAHTNERVFNYRQNRLTISSSGNSIIKLKALTKEENWYKEFLIRNQEDSKYDEIKLLINKQLPIYFLKRKVALLKELKKSDLKGFVKYLISHKSIKLLIRFIGSSLKDFSK